MYITYCRNQKSVDLDEKTSYRLSLKGGKYHPTWLIRVSDWIRVPSSEAVNGYNTLSYCWRQSGDVKKTDNGKYDLIDNGKHCIVDGYNVLETDSNGKQNKYIMQSQPNFETMVKTYVEYTKLLQQVCLDFKVDYVRYDKECIDQKDDNAKSKEIKEMHNIYRNARYTIVMVPEVKIYDPAHFGYEVTRYGHEAQRRVIRDIMRSQWWERSWTLEEVMMSKRILVVGTDTNLFQHALHIVKNRQQ